MTIAKKGNFLVVKQGLLATNCQCCQPTTTTCGLTCPQSLEDIASDITVTITVNQLTEYGFLVPAPFQNGDVLPCTFSRMQNSQAINQQTYAAYTSDAGISQAIGTSSLNLIDNNYTPELLAALQLMQSGQKLVEVFLPCSEIVTFGADKFAVIRMYQAWEEPFATPLIARYFISNLDSELSSGRPFVNCQLSLLPPQNPLGYSVRIRLGLPVDASFVGMQIEVNPLP